MMEFKTPPNEDSICAKETLQFLENTKSELINSCKLTIIQKIDEFLHLLSAFHSESLVKEVISLEKEISRVINKFVPKVAESGEKDKNIDNAQIANENNGDGNGKFENLIDNGEQFREVETSAGKNLASGNENSNSNNERLTVNTILDEDGKVNRPVRRRISMKFTNKLGNCAKNSENSGNNEANNSGNNTDNNKAKLIKTIANNNGGTWFHPREMINDIILVTGGRDGIIKFWDIKTCNRKFELINQIDVEVQWITSIKYDRKSSSIITSTYSEYLFIFFYNVDKNSISRLKTIKTELNLIYGFDFINTASLCLLACSGYTESLETVILYKSAHVDSENVHVDVEVDTDDNYADDLNFMLHQAIVPLKKSVEMHGKNYSKSLKFCEKLNLLIIGLLNGIIEVYKIDHDQTVDYRYSIKLATSDWVYQIQIVNSKDNKNYILASNANSFYKIAFSEHGAHKIKNKEDFIGSIHDFVYVNYNDEDRVGVCVGNANNAKKSSNAYASANIKTSHNNGEGVVLNQKELAFIKIKTGMVVIYDLAKNQIIEILDESKNKGSYDHCLIASKSERMIFSCRDHEILVYKY